MADRSAARVLFVSHSSKRYGAERSLHLLAAGLDRQQFEPLVALPEQGPLREALERDGVETVVVRCPWWVRSTGRGGRIMVLLALPAVVVREVLSTIRLCGLIRRRGIDLVCTNTAVILGGAPAARLCGRPHLWHVREILPGNRDLRALLPLGLLHRLIFRLSRRVLANSAATAAALDPNDQHDKLQVVPNAVAPLPGDRPPADLAGVEGLDREDLVVAWIGSLQPRKAPEDAIRAVALAREGIPRLKLLLMGDGRDDYVHGLHRLAVELGVEGRLVFAGYRPDARQLLSGCRALVMTAPDEPFGRVVAEAMLDGVPVVAVGGGGVTEMIEDRADGLLCPPGDPRALARCLVRLHDDPQLAAGLARSAAGKASAAWAPERYVREIQTAMRRAVEEA